MRFRPSVRTLVLWIGASLAAAWAQSGSAPVLSALGQGSNSVSGRAAPDSGPITIYDLSYQVRTKLGVAPVTDRDGNFAAAVKPKLVTGHKIVAIDKFGRSSAEATVAPPVRTEAER